MLKRFILVSLIGAVATFCGIVNAQTLAGAWTLYPNIGNSKRVIKNTIETKNYVYTQDYSTLLRLDKNTNTTCCLNSGNGLNGNYVKSITGNPESDVLVVVYTDSNIDIITSDGTAHNVPQIKNSSLTSKNINYVSFDGNDAYLASDYGFSVLDCTDFKIKETHRVGTTLTGVGIVKDYIVYTTNNKIYWEKRSSAQYDFAKCLSQDASSTTTLGVFPMGDNSFIAEGDTYTNGYSTCSYRYTFSDDFTSLTSTQNESSVRRINKTLNGSMYVVTTSTPLIKHFDKTGALISQVSPLTAMSNFSYASYSGEIGTYYFYTPDATAYSTVTAGTGFFKTKIANSKMETLGGPYSVNAPHSSSYFYASYSPAQKKVYVTHGIYTKHGAKVNGIIQENYNSSNDLNSFDGSNWVEMTPQQLPKTGGGTQAMPVPFTPIVFDPNDKDIYYTSSWFQGAYRMNMDGTCLAHYDPSNSTLQKCLNWYIPVNSMEFDKQGNLWCIQSNGNSPINILKAASINKTTSELTKSDWVTYAHSYINNYGKSAHMFISQSTGYVYCLSGDWDSALVVIDANGNIEDTSNYRIKKIFPACDENGSPLSTDLINCFAEDQNGDIWMGTMHDALKISQSEIFNDNFRFNRVKLSDSNESAIYDDVDVISIMVDSFNRKWIGTDNDGLYIIGADGTTILGHFTMSNSPLPSNLVSSICWDSNRNTAFIVTFNGIVEYALGKVASAKDYSNVYVYPSIVTPDFTGWISIQGLMDKSNVQVSTADGTIVFNGVSDGGSISWDGNDTNGIPVKSGTYYVCASQETINNTASPVISIQVAR